MREQGPSLTLPLQGREFANVLPLKGGGEVGV